MPNSIPPSAYPTFNKRQLVVFFSAVLGVQLTTKEHPFIWELLDELFPSLEAIDPDVSMQQMVMKITEITGHLQSVQTAAKESRSATERRWHELNKSDPATHIYWAQPGETFNLRLHAEVPTFACNCE